MSQCLRSLVLLSLIAVNPCRRNMKRLRHRCSQPFGVASSCFCRVTRRELCSITPSRARRSTVVSAACGSYFNVPKMQQAIVATSASRGQRAMAKVSGTSTRCRFVSANSCSVFITALQSLGDLAEHSLHHALELHLDEFGENFFAQDEPQVGIEFGRADIADLVLLVLGCGAAQ